MKILLDPHISDKDQAELLMEHHKGFCHIRQNDPKYKFQNQQLLAMNEQNSIVTGIATELMPAENIESEIVQKFHRFYGEYYMKPERLNVIAKTVR